MQNQTDVLRNLWTMSSKSGAKVFAIQDQILTGKQLDRIPRYRGAAMLLDQAIGKNRVTVACKLDGAPFGGFVQQTKTSRTHFGTVGALVTAVNMENGITVYIHTFVFTQSQNAVKRTLVFRGSVERLSKEHERGSRIGAFWAAAEHARWMTENPDQTIWFEPGNAWFDGEYEIRVEVQPEMVETIEPTDDIVVLVKFAPQLKVRGREQEHELHPRRRPSQRQFVPAASA